MSSTLLNSSRIGNGHHYTYLNVQKLCINYMMLLLVSLGLGKADYKGPVKDVQLGIGKKLFIHGDLQN